MFDLVSHGRGGPGDRARLSPAEVRQIASTVRRSPEVMVKVLGTGATSAAAVRRHLEYVGREGKLDLMTDDGQKIRGDDTDALVEDWDLDLEEARPGSALKPSRHQSSPRLVHKLVFSMPAGTAPHKVLGAVQNFCREEFALKNRYAFALHTDEPHPHVHVIVKAVSEQGVRLNIGKATLRDWREGFADQLRQVGVEANATSRFIRGETKPRKKDGIYRAAKRGESTHMRTRVLRAVAEAKNTQADPAFHRILSSRQALERQWAGVIGALEASDQHGLAVEARKFASRLPPARTEAQWMVAAVVDRQNRTRSDRAPADRAPPELTR